MKQQKQSLVNTILSIAVLLLYSIEIVHAKPSLARMTNLTVDRHGDLIAPDENYYQEALRYYHKGAKDTALQRFLFAAEFGNTKAVKYASLMYLDGDGIPKDSYKGLALLKIAAKRGDKESLSLLKSYLQEIDNDQISLIEKEYDELKESYGNSATLSNVYKFYRRYKFQTLDRPNFVRFEGKNVNISEMQILKLETQARQYYIDFKNNMGEVELGDIIIKDE